jgi:streptomycin 6-kinase
VAPTAPPLARFLELWSLEMVGRPSAGGREPYPGTGEVAFVSRGDAPLVLKTIPDDTDEARSGEVLAHWDGHGAVRLVEQAPGAVLIERARPGEDLTGLVARGEDDAATDILCEVMAKLNRPPPAGAAFRTVADWGAGFARNRAAAIALGVDAALVDHAASVFEDLCRTQGPAIVLHGDLQHYNVVRDAARGWLAIDPKGVLGEGAYETGAMLRNPNADPALCADPAIIARRARRICERLGYPYERVIGWCFSQWMLAVLWAIEDHLPYAPDWLRGPLGAETLLRDAFSRGP